MSFNYRVGLLVFMDAWCLRGVPEDTSGGVACLNTSVFYRGWIDDQMGGERVSCFPPFAAIFDRWALLPS